MLYTFRRIVAGKFSGSNGLGPIDLTSTRALDKHTVLVSMSKPFAGFVERLAAFWYYLYIAPASFDPARPNGTGPFVYHSFSPGERSVLTRNPHYWKNALPHVDTLTVIDFGDAVSLQDALTTGVVHGAGTLDGSQIKALSGASGVRTVISGARSIIPFTMRVDQAPFSDVSVRQALRLLVDRQQLIDSALDGYGTKRCGAAASLIRKVPAIGTLTCPLRISPSAAGKFVRRRHPETDDAPAVLEQPDDVENNDLAGVRAAGDEDAVVAQERQVGPEEFLSSHGVQDGVKRASTRSLQQIGRVLIRVIGAHDHHIGPERLNVSRFSCCSSRRDDCRPHLFRALNERARHAA